MPSSRREQLYLSDIVAAADAIARFLGDVEREQFARDDLLQSAVLHKLQVIGEAAAHVGEATRAELPGVPWRAVVGFRNFTVHAYFAVDWETVWFTARADAPAIADAIRGALGPAGGGPTSD